MKKVLLFGSVAAVFVMSACKKDNNNNVSSQDQTFLMQATISNNAEIMAGNLAATKGTNASVKAYGQMMVMEHGMAKSDLQSTVSNTGQSIPADTVDAMHKALMTRLSSLSGRAFDTAYINSQVMDHQMTLANFNTEISSGSNQNTKDYANKYQPHIQMHLKTADSLSHVL